jgi:hypothetical protein
VGKGVGWRLNSAFIARTAQAQLLDGQTSESYVPSCFQKPKCKARLQKRTLQQGALFMSAPNQILQSYRKTAMSMCAVG